jgi:pimeloyl-ACP methyl ester carboxylesterase
MSADRLSYTPKLPSPHAALLGLGARLGLARFSRGRALRRPLLARRSELVREEIGRIVYYTSAHDQVSAGERPLLLLHGMHLNAGAQDFAHLFGVFQAQRHIYAPDLPGFGASERPSDECDPELYVASIKQLIELCASDALLPLDIVAVGLSCEYTARAVAALPDMVNTLTLIAPTGFATERAESVLERLARSGNTMLPFSVLERLGLGRLCRGGFAAVLSGAAFPKGNPQAAYTRVHCPTLVLHARDRKARYGTLARFVRWREHYQERELTSTCLADSAAAAQIALEMSHFFTHDEARDPARERRQEAQLRAG